MPAPITVIIPTYNAVGHLGPTLSSVFAGVEAGLVHQLIFADGGSTDSIGLVADEVGATVVISDKGRGTQMACGAQAVQTEWILFLHADTQLSENWVNAVREHLPKTDRAGYFQLRFDETGFAPRFVAGWANLRSRVFGLPYGDQGLLISRRLYEKAGGFAQIPLMEDVALVGKLRGCLTPLKGEACTSAARYTKEGWLRRGARNITTLAMYFAGVPAEKLVKRYK